MTRQNQCQCCGGFGHNRRSCPRIKESFQRMEDLAKKYNIEISDEERRCRAGSQWKRLTEAIVAAGSPAEDNFTYRERWQWEEIQNRKNNQKITNQQGGRKCGFCHGRGHNARTCENKKVHAKNCDAMRGLAHRVVRSQLEASGLLPGALVQYRAYNYEVGQYENQFGVVTGIDWSMIAQMELDNVQGVERGFENWYARSAFILVRQTDGQVKNVALPRDIPQQSSYHFNAEPSENHPRLVSGVLGGKLNENGYEGNNVTAIDPSLPIYRWGKQMMDDKWSVEIDRLFEEVGATFGNT